MKYFKIILIFFLFLLNKTSFANENIVEILKKGGNIIFIRHAVAPGNGDPQNFDISKCSEIFYGLGPGIYFSLY